MDSSTPTGLLTLPTELFDAIVGEIQDSYETVRSLARVCRRLHDQLNPLVFESVIIRQPSTGEKFAWAITHAPHLAPLVLELQIHFHGTGDDEPFCIPEEFEPVIAQLANLETLVVKSDYFDNEQDTNLFCRPDVLPALRECKLTHHQHYSYPGVFIITMCEIALLIFLSGHLGFDFDTDEATWILHPYEAVFFHQGLRSLTITGACVQTPWPRLSGAPAHRSTQLEELRLLNCDVSPGQLSEMLSYPHALKHFTFKGQAPDPIVTGPAREANRSLYIDALKPHASSLESLDLDLYYPWREPISLRDFKALKRITISPWMLTGDGNEWGPGSGYLPSTFAQTHLTFRQADEPETSVMEENEHCPCSCWSYRHRLDDTYP